MGECVYGLFCVVRLMCFLFGLVLFSGWKLLLRKMFFVLLLL